MIMSLAPERRTHNVSQIIPCVTQELKQPADLESFLHPIIEELYELAHGIPGDKIAGMAGEHTIRAFLMQSTADMRAIDIINAKRHNGRTPGRDRNFQRAQYENNKNYYPPRHPITGGSIVHYWWKPGAKNSDGFGK